MKYRKLTKSEIEQIFGKSKLAPEWLRKYVEKFYPESAVRVVLLIDSNYNDEGYNNSVVGLIVFDKDENELTPRRGLSMQAREYFISVKDYVKDSNDPVDNLTYWIKDESFPELYVKDE